MEIEVYQKSDFFTPALKRENNLAHRMCWVSFAYRMTSVNL